MATDSLKGRTLRTGVAVTEVFDEVARADAERRLVLLDACRERISQGTRGTEESAMRQSFADAIAQAKGSVVLSGATLGGFAYDDPERQNGVFTAAILDGLHGEAPAGPEGWITIRTLADFVQQRVAQWVRRNWPDHVVRSKGIERRIEANAEGLPLALHPEAKKRQQADSAKREATGKNQTGDWRRTLLIYLDTKQELFKTSGSPDAALASLRKRISDPALSSEKALSIIIEFISKLSLQLTLAQLDNRLESEVRVVCSRGCVPINLNLIDFYTDTAKLVDRWIKEFLDKHVSSLNMLLWDIRKIASKRITRRLAEFLSSKIAILVADWRAEVLHPQRKTVTPKILSQLSKVTVKLREHAETEATRLGLPYPNQRTFAEISSATFTAWIENRVAAPWLTLFSPMYLNVAQLATTRTGGTPREILRTIITKEILAHGEQQEFSVPGDIANFALLNCFFIDPFDQGRSKSRPTDQTVLRKLEESRLTAISLMGDYESNSDGE